VCSATDPGPAASSRFSSRPFLAGDVAIVARITAAGPLEIFRPVRCLSREMRAPRLLPITQRRIAIGPECWELIALGACLRCVRALPRRGIKTERQLDLKAEEKFVRHAASTPVATLLAAPHRDTHSYDDKPGVQFSTPAISALHARIGLPAAFPLSTLSRCLTDPSMQPDHALHNEALSVIGSGLLEYYVAEYLCVRWPRLPMKTQLAALWAYTGESALARIAREWGIKSTILQVRMGKEPLKEDTSAYHDPQLVVSVPRSAEEKADAAQFEQSFEYEVREQARLGWLEPRARPVKGGFVNTMEDQDYQKRFVLFAMQRFVQSLVGAVLIHSVQSLKPKVPRLSRDTNMSVCRACKSPKTLSKHTSYHAPYPPSQPSTSPQTPFKNSQPSANVLKSPFRYPVSSPNQVDIPARPYLSLASTRAAKSLARVRDGV